MRRDSCQSQSNGEFSYLISDVFEAESSGVEGGCLLCISNVEFEVIETVEDSNGGLNMYEDHYL